MLDRLKRHLEEFIEAVLGRRLLYAYPYTATVVSQFASGEVEVLPDDTRIRGQGQATIILRHGMPGTTVEVDPGQRLVLAFEGGNPDKPFALSYDPGAAFVDDINIDAQTKIDIGDTTATLEKAARDTDPVEAGFLAVDNVTAAPVDILYWAPEAAPGVAGVYTLVATSPGPPAPAFPGTQFTGTITDGSAKVNIED